MKEGSRVGTEEKKPGALEERRSLRFEGWSLWDLETALATEGWKLLNVQWMELGLHDCHASHVSPHPTNHEDRAGSRHGFRDLFCVGMVTPVFGAPDLWTA